MSQNTVLRCHCEHHNILGVLLGDGRLEVRKDGKSTIVSGGDVVLRCLRCGEERKPLIDVEAGLAYA